MSVMLVLSSVVTTLLISPDDYREGDRRAGRALAHLAHGFFSAEFASIYDIWTILILWLAGASAMATAEPGPALPAEVRHGAGVAHGPGQRPRALRHHRRLRHSRASVEARSGAYATGVLALILSAALAVTLAPWRASGGRPAYFGAMTLVVAYTLVDNCVERPDG